MNIIASYNIKGGVGKTSTIVNLSYCSAMDGYRTLLWDLDPQAAATFYFRIKPRIKGGGSRLLEKKNALYDAIKGSDYKNLDIVPADFSLRNLDLFLDEFKKPTRKLIKMLKSVEEDYDFIFLDCAPSISLVSESILFAANVALIPTIPTVLSLRTLDQLIKFCGKHEISTRILPVFSMVDTRKEMHRSIVQNPPKLPEPMLMTLIPYNSQIEKMGEHRSPVFEFEPWGVAAKAYLELWTELQSRL